MRPRAIATVEQVQVVDDALEKRVELHLHTSMSDMDGMTLPADLIKQAHKWGQKAVAITDHGVAQAFPEAMNTVEVDPQGVARSLRCSMARKPILSTTWCLPWPGRASSLLTGDFICFDLETTGAQRPKRPDHGDRRRAHPRRGRSPTGLTPSWTRSGPSRRRSPSSLPSPTTWCRARPRRRKPCEQFFEFCGEDAVLVAHNASFDAGFVRAALQRQGKPFPNTYHRYGDHGPVPAAGPEKGHPGFRGQLLES